MSEELTDEERASYQRFYYLTRIVGQYARMISWMLIAAAVLYAFVDTSAQLRELRLSSIHCAFPGEDVVIPGVGLPIITVPSIPSRPSDKTKNMANTAPMVIWRYQKHYPILQVVWHGGRLWMSRENTVSEEPCEKSLVWMRLSTEITEKIMGEYVNVYPYIVKERISNETHNWQVSHYTVYDPKIDGVDEGSFSSPSMEND
jgi:hypothetical protein